MSKKWFNRIFTGLILLYFIIFGIRVVYDLTTYQEKDITTDYNIYYQGEKEEKLIKNYASSRMEYVAVDAGVASVTEQKYERIANIASKTVNFDSDFQKLKDILETNKAIIQMENSSGLQGSRCAELVIGVRPENFDNMQASISLIGRIVSSTSTKIDKTYEYRQMVAEKESLERRRASYEELKSRSGSISEMLQLEDKIIEVESLIQQELIGLGEYSDENAFCTINFKLYEGSEANTLRKIWNAFQWSTITYVIFLAVLIFSAFTSMVLVKIWCYLKNTIVDKTNNQKVT